MKLRCRFGIHEWGSAIFMTPKAKQRCLHCPAEKRLFG
jgi:hypothetical protein